MKVRVDPTIRRRGSALLLSLLVLLILVAIMAQLVFGTRTDADVARNDLTLTTMDLAIESKMLDAFDQLKMDGESAAASPSGAGGSGGAGGGASPDAPADPTGAAAAAGGEQEQQPSDSREDGWARPNRAQFNDIELRVFIQDEDSKLNVLSMLTANEEEAELAFERVVQVLDKCRDGTDADIDRADAQRMATAMREFMRDRRSTVLPKPRLLSDDEEDDARGLPTTLKEFAVLEPFDENHFRDFRDERGQVVHSIGAFLTVWTSLGGAGGASGAPGGQPATGGSPDANPPQTPDGGSPQGAPGAPDAGAPVTQGQPGGTAQGGGSSGAPEQASGASGEPGATQPGGAAQPGSSSSKAGVAVNVNTTPTAVLKSLCEDRLVPDRFWDKVIEYRNLEEEGEDDQSEDEEPVYDEYGEEVIQRRVFDGLDELQQVDGFDDLSMMARARIKQLLTTQSGVFSIYITARKVTGKDADTMSRRGPAEREDVLGNALTRTVRAVVWRRSQGDEVTLVPIVRWEVLDYTPFEVRDYPDEDR